MTVGQAGSLAARQIRGTRRHAAASIGVRRMAGLAALVACVCAAAWIAVGASDGLYLLELPTTANPAWIDGPLRGLSSALGSLDANGLSFALLALGAGYLVALLCADAVPLRVCLVSIVLANLAFTLGPTIVSTDVFGYIAYAREVALHGLNPYVSPPVALSGDHVLQFVYWKHQPSPYGPLFTFLGIPLGFLSTSAALWTLKAVAGLASIATALLVADTARLRGIDPSRAAIFVGLNPVLLFYAVSGAHNDLLATLLVVSALALTLRGREGAGAGVAVAAAAIKLTAGLALPFVLLAAARRGRALRGMVIGIVVIGLPTLALVGPAFIDQLHRISTDPLFDTVYSGPDRLATALGTHIDSGVRLAAAATAGLGAVASLLWARRGGDPVTAAGWAFLALLVSVASLAPWYLVWLLPLAALARGRRLRVASLLASAYLFLPHVPALGGQPWLSQAGATSYGAGAGIAAVSERQRSAAGMDNLHRAIAGVRDEHQAAAFIDGDRVRLPAGHI